jgi:hypothetical protein
VGDELGCEDAELEAPAPGAPALPLPALAWLEVAGAGVLPLACGWAAPAESSKSLPESVPLPSANRANVRPNAAAREVLANELAGPGPIRAPTAIPVASINTARTAPTRREGNWGIWGGGGVVIGWSEGSRLVVESWLVALVEGVESAFQTYLTFSTVSTK